MITLPLIVYNVMMMYFQNCTVLLQYHSFLDNTELLCVLPVDCF